MKGTEEGGISDYLSFVCLFVVFVLRRLFVRGWPSLRDGSTLHMAEYGLSVTRDHTRPTLYGWLWIPYQGLG